MILHWVRHSSQNVEQILNAFWFNFCQKLTFWLHLRSFGGLLGSWGPNGSLNPWFWGPLGVPLGSLSSEISLPFLLKNLDCFLHAFWLPKWSQMPPEMKPNFIQNSSCFRLRSHTAFHPAFGKLFSRFPKRSTFDSTAIYSVFLGLSLFGKVQKGSQNDHPKWRQGAPKTTPKPSKGQSKN